MIGCDRGVDVPYVGHGEDARDAGQAAQGVHHPFCLYIEHDDLSGIHVRGVKPVRATIEALVVEPDRRTGYGDLGDGLQRGCIPHATEFARTAPARGGGIEQTALHNHLLHESPRILYLHVAGRGAPAKLAAAVHAALLVTGMPLSSGAPRTLGLALDTAQIAQAIGVHGKANGGVYQMSVPRGERITMDGTEVPPSMGVATAINCQPTTMGNAAITGDFALIAPELNPVIRTLEVHGIAITAVHSHMLNDVPHLFFLHYWATGDASKLAHGLRAALDLMNVKKPT